MYFPGQKPQFQTEEINQYYNQYIKSVYNWYKLIKFFPAVTVLADKKAWITVFLFHSMVTQHHRALPQCK